MESGAYWVLPGFPGANIKEFLVTILSEAKRPQIQCLSLKGEFWICSEANFRMVKKSFQGAKGNLGNIPSISSPRGSLHVAPSGPFLAGFNISFREKG